MGEMGHSTKLKQVAALALSLWVGAVALSAVRGQSQTAATTTPSQAAAPSNPSTLPVRIEAKAQQILDRTIQALGGAAFLNAKTLTTHGTLGSGSGGGIVYFDSQVQFPDKRRLTYGLGKKGKPIVVINNGDQGWEIDRMGTVSLDTEDVSSWRFNNRYSLENVLRLRIHEPGTLVQAAGVDFVDNVAVNVLDMVDARQTQVKLYLSTQTGLPVQISYRKWYAEINDWDEYSDIYGNYGTYQGITVPKQISHLRNDRRVSEVFRSSAVFDETYPPGIFDDPTAPK